MKKATRLTPGAFGLWSVSWVNCVDSTELSLPEQGGVIHSTLPSEVIGTAETLGYGIARRRIDLYGEG